MSFGSNSLQSQFLEVWDIYISWTKTDSQTVEDMYVCKRHNKCRGCWFYICPKMTPCSLTGAKIQLLTDSAFFAKTYCTMMINTSGPNFITMKIEMCTFSQLLTNIEDMICGQALLLLLLLILLQLLLLCCCSSSSS